MSDSLLSDHWYRIARLNPTLRPHAELVRHSYRGEPAWILRDDLSGRQHQLNATTRFVIAMMDGRHTIEAIWNAGMKVLDEQAPTQDDLLGLLARLHSADLLQTDISPDVAELFRRQQSGRRKRLLRNFANPIFMRLPLFDPDQLLQRLLPWCRWLFRRRMLQVFLLLVAVAGLLAGVNFDALVTYGGTHALQPLNVLLLWLVFPTMKALHELGHGIAVQRFGGEVHETGIMLLILLPVPYVDASAASAFVSKRQRIVVGAAGMVVELTLAALALFAWLYLDDGIARQIAFDALLIGGVSSIAFNANPLMRFDGYYMLADLLEIPNLARRATAHWAQWAKRVLLGPVVNMPDRLTAGERAWLFGYGAAAFAWRIVLIVGISFYLLDSFPLIGMALVAWSLVAMALVPLLRSVGNVVDMARTTGTLGRALSINVALAASIGAGVFMVPLGMYSTTTGVVWPADDAIVRAGTDCFVERLLVTPDTHVDADTPLVACEDPVLRSSRAALRAQVNGVRHELQGYPLRERVKRRVARDELEQLQAELELVDSQIESLTVTSTRAGVFAVPDASAVQGRFFPQGQTIGFLLDPGGTSVRAVLRQEHLALLAVDRDDAVVLRLADNWGATIDSHIVSTVPAAAAELPSAALAAANGGPVFVDPDDDAGTRIAEEGIYLVELALPPEVAGNRIGTRVHVRIDHGREPLAQRWYRHASRVLSEHLDV